MLAKSCSGAPRIVRGQHLEIEKNIEEYLNAEPGSERPALERLRDAIGDEEAEKREGEDWSIAKNFVRSWLSWLA